jgi:prevent-host-death family protein
MTTVGAFEAKTHLPKLLERVEAGESIIITRHGEEVAHLVPPPHKPPQGDLAAAVEKWRKTRRGIRLGKLKIRDLINEGRR